jgi:dihydroorotate dehydrogenase
MTATASAHARTVMGLEFPTPVGLAAGFDRHGELLRQLEIAGFGFVELGTVTPLPEPPHNLGVDAVVANLGRPGHGRRRACSLRVGVSIRANADTPLARAVDSYRIGLVRVWPHADFVTINLSAPPARRLLAPEHEATLGALLGGLREAQAELAARSDRHVSLVVKVGLDPAATELPAVVGHARRLGFDGLIAAIGPGDRGLEPTPAADALTRAQAADSVRRTVASLAGSVPVVSVGGIRSPTDAAERLQAGAALVQLYRGYADHGPALVRAILDHLARVVAA